LLKSFSSDLLPQRQAKNATDVSSSLSANTHGEIDFGITGTFGERDFFIISDGTDRKTWIFMDNEFMAVFQEYKELSKKEQFMPYILIDSNVSDTGRRDLIRMAIMSRCLNALLN